MNNNKKICTKQVINILDPIAFHYMHKQQTKQFPEYLLTLLE